METTEKIKFEVGDEVICINTDMPPGNEVKPSLEKDKSYIIKAITLDYQKNQHLDVGLKSIYNYIRSFETEEKLKDGDAIHWCHPSRFILKN